MSNGDYPPPEPTEPPPVTDPYTGSVATGTAPNPLPPGEEPPPESLTGLHPGSYATEPAVPEVFDTGLNYPKPGSPFDPSNPVPDFTYPPDPKQPGGITAPLEVPTEDAPPPPAPPPNEPA